MLLLICLCACTRKTNVIDPTPPGYFSTIGYILSHDPQDTTFYHWLGTANLQGQLFGTSPYTVFTVPLNAAPMLFDPRYAAATGAYHVVGGAFLVGALPVKKLFPINTTLTSSFYLSKYLGYNFSAVGANVKDTLCTINGSFLSQIDFKASNGYINTLYPVLVPSQYVSLEQAISSDQSYILFNAILQRLQGSAISDTLLAAGAYTLFAPNDIAFTNFSYHGYQLQTLDNIDTANVDTLSHFVMWHLIRGRNFLGNMILESEGYDTVLTARTPSSLATVKPVALNFSTFNGYTLVLTPKRDKTIPAPYYCNGVTVGVPKGGSAFIAITDQNAFGIPVGNGVLYKISSILHPK